MRRTSGRGSKPVEVFDPVKEASRPQVRHHLFVIRYKLVSLARARHSGLRSRGLCAPKRRTIASGDLSDRDPVCARVWLTNVDGCCNWGSAARRQQD